MEIKGIAKDVAWVEQHGYTRLIIGSNKAYINSQLSSTINGTKVKAQGELKTNKKGEPYFLATSISPVVPKKAKKADVEKEKQALMPILQYLKAQGKKGKAEKVLRCKEAPEKILRAPHLLYLNDIIDFSTAEALLDCVFAAHDTPERLASIIKHELNNAYNSSKSCLSVSQLIEIAERTYTLSASEDDIKKVKKSIAIVDEQDNAYIPKIYSFRSKVLKQIYNNQPAFADYDDEQIAELMSYKYSILTGGAGTGKTTILNKIAALKSLNVAMTAMTGKAATRLTGGRTLHSLLGYKRGKFTVTHLPNDLIIVDEASMLDWYTASALFKAAKGNIIFAGDPKQLPPVKGGSVFKEIIELLPCVELTQAHRFQTKDGKLKIEHIRKNNVFDLVTAVIMLALKLKAQNADYAVITPVKNCQFGTYNLNEKLRESLNPEGLQLDSSYFRVGDKVVVTKNVYCDGELYAANGETGVVCGIEYIDYQKFIAIKIGHDKKLIDETDLELAFCLTVHKVQGSQADYVIFVNPKSQVNADFMSEEMQETGLTRSRRTTYCLTL